MLETALVSLRTPPSTPVIPFRFLTTAPVSILPCLASSFVIEDPDLYSFSPGSSIFDNCASISSYESHVVQFQYGCELRAFIVVNTSLQWVFSHGFQMRPSAPIVQKNLQCMPPLCLLSRYHPRTMHSRDIHLSRLLLQTD